MSDKPQDQRSSQHTACYEFAKSDCCRKIEIQIPSSHSLKDKDDGNYKSIGNNRRNRSNIRYFSYQICNNRSYNRCDRSEYNIRQTRPEYKIGNHAANRNQGNCGRGKYRQDAESLGYSDLNSSGRQAECAADTAVNATYKAAITALLVMYFVLLSNIIFAPITFQIEFV